MPSPRVDAPVSEAPALLTPRRIQDLLLLAASAVVLYLCWLVVRPFLAVITWSAALALVGSPLHVWLESKLRRPHLAALLSVLLLALVLFGPGIFIAQKLYEEASDAARKIHVTTGSGSWRTILEGHPRLAASVDWVVARVDLDNSAKQLSAWLAARAPAFFTKSIWALIQLVLTLLTLFYFLRDRSKLIGLIRRLVPLSSGEADSMFDRISQAIRVSFYGSVLVKIVQGLLGGLMFWILGLPAPVLCGAAMSLCAILPIAGTGLIWGPAAALLALEGSWVKALILAIWGAVVVGLVDNLLYPLLVADEINLHPLAAFLAVLGGLIAFGPSGVVLGPVLLAVTSALLDVWRVRMASS